MEGVGRGGRWSWRALVVEGVGRGGRRSWRALVVEGVGTMGSTWGPALGQSTMIAMITYRVSAKTNVSQCIERAGRGKSASKPRTLNRKEDVGNSTWTESSVLSRELTFLACVFPLAHAHRPFLHEGVVC